MRGHLCTRLDALMFNGGKCPLSSLKTNSRLASRSQDKPIAILFVPADKAFLVKLAVPVLASAFSVILDSLQRLVDEDPP